MGIIKIKSDAANTIGSNLRQMRLRKGIGQTDLARCVTERGVSLSRESLVKIEHGTQHITLSQLNAMREILDCSYTDLLGE